VHSAASNIDEPSIDELERQLELASRVDALLAQKGESGAKKAPFLISREDGRAVTACPKGDERSMLQWLFDSLHPVISAGRAGEDSMTLPLSAALATILSAEPRSPVESLLLVQLLASHSLATQFGARALTAADSTVSSRLAERARGFMEVSCRQMETLLKLRGESVSQKVVVQHVNMAEGAQAIIGQVGAPHSK
jgi:hypothetical protein